MLCDLKLKNVTWPGRPNDEEKNGIKSVTGTSKINDLSRFGTTGAVSNSGKVALSRICVSCLISITTQFPRQGK